MKHFSRYAQRAEPRPPAVPLADRSADDQHAPGRELDHSPDQRHSLGVGCARAVPGPACDRRRFLHHSAASIALLTVAGAEAREPIERSGPPRFHFGLAAYSLRDYFAVRRGQPQQAADDGPEMDMFGFVDYCAANGFDGAELTSYFFPSDLDDAYLRRLKRHAFEQGVTICGTAIGNNFTGAERAELKVEIDDCKRWIDRAAVLGAPHLRIFAGTARQLTEGPERLSQAITAIEQCAEHAASQGVYLGVENHGRLSADQMLTIIRRIQSPWVGINLDTGNFVSEDPYADMAACAPFAVNVQVKAKIKSLQGDPQETDYGRIAKILRAATYQGQIVLEYEEPQPYQHIPGTLSKLRSAFST